jgi:hypothetical protein
MQEELLVPGHELLTTYSLPGGFKLREYRLLKGYLALPELAKTLRDELGTEFWMAGECFYGVYFVTASSVEVIFSGLVMLGRQDLDAYKHPGVHSVMAWSQGFKASDFDPYFHAEPDLDQLIVGAESY